MSILVATLVAMLALGQAGSDALVSQEPAIDVSARDSIYQFGAGEWRFAGDVRIVYGTVTVHGDLGTVQLQDEEISWIEVSGNPGSWRDILEDGGEISGEASNIRYDVRQKLLVMSGDTRVKHSQGVYLSDRLVYDLGSKVLSGNGDEGGRVRMTIRPAQPPGNE